jgi:hypothetical protein
LIIADTAHISFAALLLAFITLLGFILLLLRRSGIGGELGGPACVKIFSAAFLGVLWLAFVVFTTTSSFGLLGVIESFTPDVDALGV